MPVQVVVTFGDAKGDQLGVVLGGDTGERREAGARLGPPARCKQTLCAIELLAEPVARNQRRSLKPFDPVLGVRRLIAQRKLVVHALIRFDGRLAVASGLERRGKPQ